MMQHSILRGFAIIVATAALLSPQAMHDSMAAEHEVVVTDVALWVGGKLFGQVVDQQGNPQANSMVSVTYQGAQVALVQTDTEGHFTVSGLRGGVHAIQTAEGIGVYRLWASQAAPPAAARRVLVVNDGLTQRGNLAAAILYPSNFTRTVVAAGLIGGAGYLLIDHNASGS